MAENQPLRTRIAALRVRLDRANSQAFGISRSGSFPLLPLDTSAPSDDETTSATVEGTAAPVQVTLAPVPLPPGSEAVQASLERGRGVLATLRSLSEDPLLRLSDEDPLNRRFDDCAAMVDLGLRTVQAFGAVPGRQLALCEGLNAILSTVDERILSIKEVLHRRRAWQEAQRVHADVV